MSVCTKIPYPSLDTARRAARAIRLANQAPGRKQPKGIHWCAEHQRWHLTSKQGQLRL